MTDLPEPPIPADVDLQGYEFMPLYGHRLFGSDFNARCSDAEWRAGVTLWWAAWNQVPAGSLPDDDTALCRLADLGRDVKYWRKLRGNALRGFVKCRDGRLYHSMLCRLALEAWTLRQRQREKQRKWRERKRGNARLQDGNGDGDVTVTETVTLRPRGQDRTGQDSKKDSEPIGSAPPDLKGVVFGQGLDWLALQAGRSRGALRSLAGKWCRDYGEAAVIEVLGAAQREGPIDPVSWIERALKQRAPNGKANGQHYRRISIDERIRLREAEEEKRGARMTPKEEREFFASQGIEPRAE